MVLIGWIVKQPEGGRTRWPTISGKGRNRDRLGEEPVLFRVLWQHDKTEPIGGIVAAREDAHGLAVTGKLDLDTELGRRAHSGMKSGYLCGLSFGFDAVKTDFTPIAGKSVRRLTEIRLWEVSPVTFPANTEARVEEVKVRGRPSVAELDRQMGAVFAGLNAAAREEMEAKQRDLARAFAIAEDAASGWAHSRADLIAAFARAALDG